MTTSSSYSVANESIEGEDESFSPGTCCSLGPRFEVEVTARAVRVICRDPLLSLDGVVKAAGDLAKRLGIHGRDGSSRLPGRASMPPAPLPTPSLPLSKSPHLDGGVSMESLHDSILSISKEAHDITELALAADLDPDVSRRVCFEDDVCGIAPETRHTAGHMDGKSLLRQGLHPGTTLKRRCGDCETGTGIQDALGCMAPEITGTDAGAGIEPNSVVIPKALDETRSPGAGPPDATRRDELAFSFAEHAAASSMELTTADVQRHLMKHKTDPLRAVDDLQVPLSSFKRSGPTRRKNGMAEAHGPEQ